MEASQKSSDDKVSGSVLHYIKEILLKFSGNISFDLPFSSGSVYIVFAKQLLVY